MLDFPHFFFDFVWDLDFLHFVWDFLFDFPHLHLLNFGLWCALLALKSYEFGKFGSKCATEWKFNKMWLMLYCANYTAVAAVQFTRVQY